MPAVFYQPIDRRQFLGRAAEALAVLGLASSVKTWAAGSAGETTPVHLALLSDTHVAADPKFENRKFLPCENLKTVVAQVGDARPEAVILNGDVAKAAGEIEDYEAVKKLLAPLAAQMPVYIGLGNHDHRDNLGKVLDSDAAVRPAVAGKRVRVIERPAIRVLLLDSLLYTNQTAGLLGKAQREWLGHYLETSDPRSTVLFVHHTLGEGDGDLLDVERLFRIIQPHRKVKAIFYGHSHEFALDEKEGVHLVNVPAVGYNFKESEPVGWVEARFTPTGVELILRAVGGNRSQDGKVTSLAWG